MILQIFAAKVSESEPPKTVKSCAKTKTGRPSARPCPVTTPSPGIRCGSHSEVVAAVDDESVELLEGTRIQEMLDALPRRELPRLVLFRDSLLAAADARLRVPAVEIVESVLRRHVRSEIGDIPIFL